MVPMVTMILGAMMFLAGWGLWIANLVMTLMQKDSLGNYTHPEIPYVLLIAAVYFFNRGRRQSLLSQDQDAGSVPAPTESVVYLRSFRHDRKASTPGAAGGPLYSFSVATEEEQLLEVLSDVGPAISLGRPGEQLPYLGAHRIYVPDADWQDVILQWVKVARLVVLRVGDSAGVSWELETIPSLVTPERLVLIVPKSEVSNLNKYVTKLVGRTVQLEIKARVPLFHQSLAALVSFGSGWEPRAISFRMPVMIFDLVRPYRPMYQFAFQSIFERLGVPWNRPHFNWIHLGVVLAILSIMAMPVMLDLLVFLYRRTHG
jgi:hypothetical protein